MLQRSILSVASKYINQSTTSSGGAACKPAVQTIQKDIDPRKKSQIFAEMKGILP